MIWSGSYFAFEEEPETAVDTQKGKADRFELVSRDDFKVSSLRCPLDTVCVTAGRSQGLLGGGS